MTSDHSQNIALPRISPSSLDYAAPVKRSLTLRGHRTSVSLEPAFWALFQAEATRRGRPVAALAADIDAARPPDVGLACALRLFIVETLNAHLNEHTQK